MKKTTLDIYPSYGDEPRVSALLEKGSVWDTMLMQKDEIRLKFTTSEAVTFHRGDYAHVPGAGIFEIMDESQRPDYDTGSGAYVYNIKLIDCTFNNVGADPILIKGKTAGIGLTDVTINGVTVPSPRVF